MDNDHPTCTDEFGACCGDDQFLTTVCGPCYVDELCLPLQSLDFSISDGGALNGVVDVGAEILDDFATLELINEYRLRDCPIIRGICEIFLGKIT